LGQFSCAHLFVLAEIMAHIEELDARMGRFEQALLQGLSAGQPQLTLLQTLFGIEQMEATMLLVEINANIDQRKPSKVIERFINGPCAAVQTIGIAWRNMATRSAVLPASFFFSRPPARRR
jgi:hypothetical protein